MYNKKEILDSLSKATKNLMLIDSPFYAFYVIGINRVVTTGIDTMGVGIENNDYVLYINPYFWKSLTNDQQMGLLKHEILHMVFEHPLTLRRFTNSRKANIAADLEINSYIDSNWLPNVELEQLNKEDFDSIDEYYIELYKNGAPKGCYAQDRNLALKKGTTYYYNQLKEDDNEGDNQYGDSHKHYNSTKGKNDEYVKTINDNRIKEISKSLPKNSSAYSNLPSSLRSKIDNLLNPQKPVVDWKKVLRNIVGVSSKSEMYITRRKKNIRFPDMNVVTFKPKSEILCGIDTSGSMSQKDLQEVFSEMSNIHSKGVEIKVLEADAEIEAEFMFNDRALKRNKHEVSGRGGTSFTPVVEYFNKSKYNLLVYLTDGYAPPPSVPVVRGKKVLWVITTNGCSIDRLKEFPGAKVKMVNNE